MIPRRQHNMHLVEDSGNKVVEYEKMTEQTRSGRRMKHGDVTSGLTTRSCRISSVYSIVDLRLVEL